MSDQITEKARQFLVELSENTDFLRVEIEATSYFFYSQPVLGDTSVTLTIPAALAPNLAEGGWVRLGFGETSQEVLRMQSLDRAPAKGPVVTFQCPWSSASIEPKQRASPRYFTGHFENLKLVLPDGGSCPILDMTVGGIRVAVPAENSPFVIGTPISPGGEIMLESDSTLAVEEIIPRFQVSGEAGLEYSVGDDPHMQTILSFFLDSLDAEIMQISIPPED